MGTLIDLSNYDTLLTESMATRSGTPPGSADGNIFFDTTSGLIELITVEELATVRLPTGIKSGLCTITVNVAAKTLTRSAGSFETDGFTAGKMIRSYGFTNAGNNVNFMEIATVAAGVITLVLDTGLVNETGNGDERIIEFGATAVANPLADQEGIAIGAVYAFERQQRRVNEYLRQYDFYGKGTFKYAGAYELVNGRLFSTVGSSTTDDRRKLRASGWLERDAGGAVTETRFGVRSLGNIEDLSQPYYQLTAGGAPVDFTKDGPIDEAIAVTGSMDYLSNKVRTYGNNYDEKTLVDSGIAEMSGYTAGFAIGESPHLTTVPATYPLVDVYTTPIAPWNQMHLDKLVSAQNETGFNEGAGDFTWVLTNDGNGTLNECIAFLDALAQTDDDINTSTPPVTNGKRVSTWYTYSAAGKIITRSGAGDSLGLFIENIPIADQQSIIFTSDGAGGTRTYPFVIDFKIVVGANAAADPNGWFHVWEDAGYGTGSAVTVLDANGEEMKGSTYGASLNTISLGYAATDGAVDIVVECEGDGIATQAKTEGAINITDAVQTIVCSPGQETNV